MRSFLALSLVLAACGETGLGGPDTCKGLDETQCRARAHCSVGTCTDCSGKGGGSFAGCYDPQRDSAPPCPAIACAPPCSLLGEAACKADPACRAEYCPTCTAAKQFQRCAAITDPLVSCPLLGCPIPPECNKVTSEAECDARPDCHPVYRDPGTCLCAQPGCCQMFVACGDGAQANCKGPVTCKAAAPSCNGPYVIGYTDTCYEGCVKQSDCAP